MAFVTKELIEKLGIIKITTGGRICTPSGYIKLQQVVDEILRNNILVTPEKHPVVLEELRSLLKAPKAQPNFLDEEVERIQVNDMGRFIPIISPKSKKDIIFFDPETRTLEQIDPELFVIKTGKYESLSELYANASMASIGFYPRVLKPYFTVVEDGKTKLALNLYRAPKWQEYEPTDAENIPERLKILLNNLFPFEEDLEYVLCWMYYAITSRNETFLCLIGSLGIGKEFFASLMGQGVGMSFYQKVDNSFIDDKFNSQMKQARVIFYDEIMADTPERLNRVKQLANKTTSIQAKGKDSYTAINESSGIMASNNLDAIMLSPQDRRFSVPRLGTKNLMLTMTEHFGGDKDKAQKELNYIYEYLSRAETEDPHEDVINFYHWLMKKFSKEAPKYNNSDPLRSEYFYFLSFTNMAAWQQVLIEYCRNNYHKLEISTKDVWATLPSEEKKQIPRAPRISKFLFSYRELGTIPVGEVVKELSTKDTKQIARIRLTQEFIEWAKKENYGNPCTQPEGLKVSEETPTKTSFRKKIPTYEEKQAELAAIKQAEEINGEEYL